MQQGSTFHALLLSSEHSRSAMEGSSLRRDGGEVFTALVLLARPPWERYSW